MFWVLSPSELFSFRVFVAISGSEKYSFELFFSDMCSGKTVNIKKTIQCTLRYLSLVFFWVGNFDARYFFGSRISVLCIFLGLQYEAPSDTPSCILYFEYLPWGCCCCPVLPSFLKRFAYYVNIFFSEGAMLYNLFPSSYESEVDRPYIWCLYPRCLSYSFFREKYR